MKKNYYFIFNILFIAIPSAAMEQQVAYPWYQSYKDPVFRKKITERISRGLHSGKELIKNNKREIAIAVALLGAAYIGKRGYDKIARVFTMQGFDLSVIKREYGRIWYYDFVRWGIRAYSHRFDTRDGKDRFMNEEVIQSELYKKLGAEKSHPLDSRYAQKLRTLYGGLPQQTGSQERFQEAIRKIMN